MALTLTAMLKAAFITLATSFIAWFVQHHEAQVVYPFDRTMTPPGAAGEPRLTAKTHKTEDGETLILWAAQPNPGRPTILYFSGNAGTLADRVGRFRALLDRGYGILAPAYRGSSGSTGRPEEALLTQDALAIASGLDGPLVLYGESLGTALAVKLAAAGHGSAIVLEAPFTSVPDLISAQYPLEDIAHLFTQTWDTRSAIGAVTQPLLILHGTEDRLIPIAQAEELLAAAGSTDKTLHRLEGESHRSVWSVEGQRTLYRFLRAHYP